MPTVRCNHCYHIHNEQEDGDIFECPKCGKDDALMEDFIMDGTLPKATGG